MILSAAGVATDRALWVLASLVFLAGATAAALLIKDLNDDAETQDQAPDEMP